MSNSIIVSIIIICTNLWPIVSLCRSTLALSDLRSSSASARLLCFRIQQHIYDSTYHYQHVCTTVQRLFASTLVQHAAVYYFAPLHCTLCMYTYTTTATLSHIHAILIHVYVYMLKLYTRDTSIYLYIYMGACIPPF
jgi:hypothetical protein